MQDSAVETGKVGTGTAAPHSAASVHTVDITSFCQRWSIRELAVFGSALRDDLSPESDIDFLVTFAEQADWGLLEHVQMEQELHALFNRSVDLVSRRALERSHNWLLRNEILRTARVLYPPRKGGHAAR